MTENPMAFPGACTSDGHAPNYGSVHEGMTLRDYFAAKALNGMMSAHAIFIKDDLSPPQKNMEPPSMRKMTDLEIATSAYQYADAMLKVRAK